MKCTGTTFEEDPVDKDELEIGTSLMLFSLNLVGGLILVILVVVFHFDIIFVQCVRAIRTGCVIVDTIPAIVIWFGIYTGIILLVLFAFNGLYYSLISSKWLLRLRLVHKSFR